MSARSSATLRCARITWIASTESPQLPRFEAMRAQLREALDHGALGLSSGLAYASARAASTEEVLTLAQPLTAASAALRHAHAHRDRCDSRRHATKPSRSAGMPGCRSSSRISNARALPTGAAVAKCSKLSTARATRSMPAAIVIPTLRVPARSISARSTLASKITITWSTPHPEIGGQTLEAIANDVEPLAA